MNNAQIRIPKYVTAYEQLKNEILAGKIKPNEQVPTVVELMRLYDVSKITAVRVLSELQNAGLIRKEQGRGSFVNERLQAPADPSASGAPGASPQTTVDFIVPDIANPFYSEIVGAASQKLQSRGMAIKLHSTRLDAEQINQQLAQVLAQRSAGIILAPPSKLEFTPELMRELAGRHVILVDNVPAQLIGRLSYVTTDNFRGGWLATQHLVDLGHRRIGLVIWRETSPDRVRGYTDVLKGHGLQPFILDVNTDPAGIQAVPDFVRQHRLSALFASNDVFAVSIKKVLDQAGIKVPADISLVGYDNIEISQYLDVPLTTVDQHESKIGTRAAELILTMSEGGDASAGRRVFEVVYEPTLIVRQSTRAAQEEAAKS
jgi:GntR family transcriptional regulator of arabinose operon